VPRLLALLSAWDLAVPGLLALLAGIAWGFGLSMGGSSFLDVSIYLLAWAWVLATPFTAVTALVIALKLRRRWAWWLHGIVLVLWGATVVFILLAPGLGRLP
jgi:hypothetical protein